MSIPALELDRAGNGDFLAIRDALKALWEAFNNEIVRVGPVSESSGTLAAQPTLTAADAGYLYRITDYGHTVRWTGVAWEFAPGDVGNKFFRTFAGAPSEVGWQLCDGTVSDYLVLGAALTVTAFTVPNVPAGTFLKALGAYTGAIDAAVPSAMSGETANVGDSGGTGNMDIIGYSAGVGPGHSVIDASSVFIHRHGAGSLAATGGAPASLGTLLYFRR